MVCYRLTHIRLIELIEAIEKGDIEAVKQHIADGADVNAEEDNGWIGRVKNRRPKPTYNSLRR